MERKARRTLVGTVVSDKMTKTIVVLVTTEKKDSLYGKKTVVSKKYKAHDEEQVAHVGDKVLIMETRPLSADKHFRLVKVLEKAGLVA
jgi:small subunit ribosomal protein S17